MCPIIVSPENNRFAFLKWTFWPSGCWDLITWHLLEMKIPFFIKRHSTKIVISRSRKYKISPYNHGWCWYLSIPMVKMAISKKQTTYFPTVEWLVVWTNQSATSNGLKNGLWGFGKSAGFEKRPLLGQIMVDFRFLGQFSTLLFKQKKFCFLEMATRGPQAQLWHFPT